MAGPLSIAIIGAGMGGLATAAALRRVGIDVTVYEQATQFARLGAGIQIGCNAMKVLRGLGLEARLRAQSFYPRSWNNRDWRTGEIKFDMIFGESAEQKFGAPYLLAHRGDLHAALASAVPDECVRLNHKLVGLEETGEGVRLTFANAATATADAVIGADGVHSAVRDMLFGVSPVNFTGRIAYRTTYPAALLNGEKIDDCTKWWGEDRHIVIYYVKPDRSEIYLVTSQPEPDFRIESWSAKGDVRKLRKAFAGFDRQVEQVLAACPDVHKWAIVDRNSLERWTDRNVTLLGDACHPMTPTWRRARRWRSRTRRCCRAVLTVWSGKVLQMHFAASKPRARSAPRASSRPRARIPGLAARPIPTGCMATTPGPRRWRRKLLLTLNAQ